VTIGGPQANIDNALKMVRRLRPRIAVPMHWEVFFRSDAKARRFAQLLSKESDGPACVIPTLHVPVEIT
jgi:L-ascorbate metabolism protein UlaG (beta-lactamase superfamily)